MVEIRYSDNYEIADMAGKPVSEARELFKAEFGIPAKAGAKLNGKKVKGKLESETCLCDDDKLTFAEAKSRKGAFLVGAMLLTLAVTGSVFAYTATTDTASMTLSAQSDYATVTANGSLPSWNVFGKYKGATGSGILFSIDPANSFTADLSASVMLANADELVNAYRVMVFRISIYSDDSGSVNMTDTVAGPAYLTLANGEVSIDIEQGSHTPPFHVYLDSGFYITHSYGSGWNDDEDPQLLCDVYQKGT